MQYNIIGRTFPVVTCTLADGESMITEGGSMVWMTPNMEMSTTGGGIGKMFSKAVSGESLFQNIWTARGNAMIAFGSSFPGRIMPIQIAPGQSWILQKRAFLAAERGVELSTHFNKSAKTGIFGGEGFIMQKLTGNGIAFAEIAATWSSTSSRPASRWSSTPATSPASRRAFPSRPRWLRVPRTSSSAAKGCSTPCSPAQAASGSRRCPSQASPRQSLRWSQAETSGRNRCRRAMTTAAPTTAQSTT